MKVSNKELIEELIKSKIKPTERLWFLLQALIKNFYRKYYDSEYLDVASDALIHCIEQRDKFDIERGTSAFSFFTQIALNVLFQNNLKRSRRVSYNNRIKFGNEFDEGVLIIEQEDYEFEKFLMTRKRQKVKQSSK